MRREMAKGMEMEVVTTPRTGREEGTCERRPVDRWTQTLPDGGRMSVGGETEERGGGKVIIWRNCG
jgi:hypothetical protein